MGNARDPHPERPFHTVMIVECPNCKQRIDLEGSGVTEFSCPSCGGQIQLQMRAEVLTPPTPENPSPHGRFKLSGLPSLVAGAVILSLFLGWLIWGRDGQDSSGFHSGVDPDPSGSSTVSDIRYPAENKLRPKSEDDQLMDNWLDHRWVIKNLDQVLPIAIDREKIQIRGTDKLAYAINTDTPYTGWVREMFRGKLLRLLRIEDGIMLLNTEWYRSGQICEWKTYHPKLRYDHGLHITWYENGNRKSEKQYEQGTPLGKSLKWHPNGNKLGEGTYIDGQKHGEWIYYYEDGKVKMKGSYRNGGHVGIWTNWDDQGEVSCKNTYDENGKLLDQWFPPSE